MAAATPSGGAGPEGAPDFLVLGLGNPGERYRDTRHNFGFLVTEALAGSGDWTFRDGLGPSLIRRFTVGENRGMLAQPWTWMNRSGLAATALLEVLEGPPLDRLLVVTDDLDLPLGRLRFRRGGGPGGHNGLRSIVSELGSDAFPRLRLGIGRPEKEGRDPVVDFVLEPFEADEIPIVREVTERAVEGIGVFVQDGVEAAMNRFNAG